MVRSSKVDTVSHLQSFIASKQQSRAPCCDDGGVPEFRFIGVPENFSPARDLELIYKRGDLVPEMKF